MSTKVRLFGGIDRGSVPRCFACFLVLLAVLALLCCPHRFIVRLSHTLPAPQRLGIVLGLDSK